MADRWLDNAFWAKGSADQTRLTGIRETIDADGKSTRQVLTMDQTTPDGSPNPDFASAVQEIGVERITANTVERETRKQREREIEIQRREEQARAKVLEELFDAKLKAFQVQEVKDCQDRVLKSKLRKAKNHFEVMAYTTTIIMKAQQDAEQATSE